MASLVGFCLAGGRKPPVDVMLSSNCRCHRHDFPFVIFQRGNDDFGLSGIRPNERLGTVPKRSFGRIPERPKSSFPRWKITNGKSCRWQRQLLESITSTGGLRPPARQNPTNEAMKGSF